jgi:arylsulfatase A-like enzyme
LPRPWFAYVAFHAVHTPVDAPEQFKQLYEGVRFHDDPRLHDSRLRLAAMASQMDAKVAELVAALDRTGQRNNTLVVFTSDNGGIESAPNPYVSDLPDSPLNSENDPLRGQKNTLYEGGIRVCAFASWPGTLAARKHEGLMHAVDWFPTIAHIAGYRPAGDLEWDGVDQWPALAGVEEDDEQRVIYFATRKGDALRKGDWKLIVNANDKPQLFNIAADPYEEDNRALAEQRRVVDLLRLMAEHQAKDNPVLPADLDGLPK